MAEREKVHDSDKPALTAFDAEYFEGQSRKEKAMAKDDERTWHKKAGEKNT